MAYQTKDIALAAEALNRVPGLSPLARRLGIEVLNRMDRQTGRCKPSEARLALSLGCDERSIRRAKVELQDAGFLCWISPGRYCRSIYQLMVSKLAKVALELKAAIRKAVTPQVLKIVNQQRIRARKAQETLKAAVNADRTKMSGNLTTLSNTKYIRPGKGSESSQGWAKNAEQRFWADIAQSKEATLLVDRLTESLLERVIEAEGRAKGAGIALFGVEVGRVSA